MGYEDLTGDGEKDSMVTDGKNRNKGSGGWEARVEDGRA
jgi:hypothetical protein